MHAFGVTTESDLRKSDDGEHSGCHQQTGGDKLRGAVANDATKNAGNQEAQKRQKDDSGVHLLSYPFITLTSSTAMEPRLRK